MIEAVIFDQGKVRCSSANEAIKQDISQTLEVDIKLVDQLWKELIYEGFGRGDFNEEEFWRLFYQRSKATKPLPEGESLLVRKMRTLHYTIPGVREICQELINKGIKLAIVSNTIPPHAQLERSLGHYDDIHTIVLSCDNDVRSRKPERKIYKIALDRLDTLPENTLVVDDDENYRDAVIALGMKWLTFTNADQLEKDLQSQILSKK